MESDRILDADPARELEENAREFGLSENPFQDGDEDRLPREDPAPVPIADEDEIVGDPVPARERTQPPLGDEDSPLEEELGTRGIVHRIDREDMGKGIQSDPEAYVRDPGRPGLVEGASPPDRGRSPGETFLDPAARAGQGRASAEDVLKGRGMARATERAPEREPEEGRGPGAKPGLKGGAPLPGSGFLDALFIDFPFPADMESVACHLAQEAYVHGGPAETFHDLVIQLDHGLFKDIHDLKNALGDRFAWELSQEPPEGGSHAR